MTPEGKVKRCVREILKNHDVYFHTPVQNGMGAPSLDFVCCYRGHYFAIETKAPGNHLTPRQELTKRAIEEAGGKVFVIGERLLGQEQMPPELWNYSGEAELEAWLREQS